MCDLEFNQLVVNEIDRLVLAAYAAAERLAVQSASSRPETAEEPTDAIRWFARIGDVAGVPGDRIAPIHGRLIAGGYLQFQLQGRDAGVVYRLTPLGRAALAAAGAQTPSELPLRRSA